MAQIVKCHSHGMHHFTSEPCPLCPAASRHREKEDLKETIEGLKEEISNLEDDYKSEKTRADDLQVELDAARKDLEEVDELRSTVAGLKEELGTRV